MGNVAIRCEHLSKRYMLGAINNGTLWRDFQSWSARYLGKDDPHSKIGQDRFSGDNNHFWALKDLSFDIQQGDRVGIIGKNGAGKSTLLKILSRITAPTEGNIKVRGKIASLLEVGTGFHGELTGRENIYLNGAILGMKKRQIDKKLDEIIAFSGIEQHIDTPVKRYSSGMFVRLGFAVAAHLDSDILIADEVLAVGDIDFQNKALGKMRNLSDDEGRTVLFVSHQIPAVRNLCNKGILLRNGALANQGEIETVLRDYHSDGRGERLGLLTELDAIPEQNGVALKNVAVARYGKDDQSKNEYADEVEITFEFQCENLDEAKYDISFHLFDETDFLIFNASTYYTHTNSAFTTSGNYKAICKIPAGLLHEGVYSVRKLMFVKNDISILWESKYIYSFKYIRPSFLYSGYYKRKVGRILPQIDWEFSVNNTSII